MEKIESVVLKISKDDGIEQALYKFIDYYISLGVFSNPEASFLNGDHRGTYSSSSNYFNNKQTLNEIYCYAIVKYKQTYLRFVAPTKYVYIRLEDINPRAIPIDLINPDKPLYANCLVHVSVWDPEGFWITLPFDSSSDSSVNKNRYDGVGLWTIDDIVQANLSGSDLYLEVQLFRPFYIYSEPNYKRYPFTTIDKGDSEAFVADSDTNILNTSIKEKFETDIEVYMTWQAFYNERSLVFYYEPEANKRTYGAYDKILAFIEGENETLLIMSGSIGDAYMHYPNIAFIQGEAPIETMGAFIYPFKRKRFIYSPLFNVFEKFFKLDVFEMEEELLRIARASQVILHTIETDVTKLETIPDLFTVMIRSFDGPDVLNPPLIPFSINSDNYISLFSVNLEHMNYRSVSGDGYHNSRAEMYMEAKFALAIRTRDFLENTYVTEWPEREPGDNSDLLETIQECEGMQEIEYRQAGWKRLVRWLDISKSVVNNENSTQHEIDVAQVHLESAMNRLIKVEIEKIETDDGDELLFENDDVMVTEESQTNDD